MKMDDFFLIIKKKNDYTPVPPKKTCHSLPLLSFMPRQRGVLSLSVLRDVFCAYMLGPQTRIMGEHKSFFYIIAEEFPMGMKFCLFSSFFFPTEFLVCVVIHTA